MTCASRERIGLGPNKKKNVMKVMVLCDNEINMLVLGE